MTTTELTRRKLEELAQDPQNTVYFSPDEAKALENPRPTWTAAESRRLVNEIRARALTIHGEFPKWTVAQVQNKLCRENPEFARFQENTTVWKKVSAWDCPVHELKHVEHLLTVVEREEKREITGEEAKQLLTFYGLQNCAKKAPKRRDPAKPAKKLKGRA